MNSGPWSVVCRDFAGRERPLRVVVRGAEVVIVAPPGETAVLDHAALAQLHSAVVQAAQVANAPAPGPPGPRPRYLVPPRAPPPWSVNTDDRRDHRERRAGVRVLPAARGRPASAADRIGLRRCPSPRTQPAPDPNPAARDRHRRNTRPGHDSREPWRMRRTTGSVPAATLLRRLGWHHRTVVCRDGHGQRTALHLRRRTHEIVEIELPGGCVAQLTNFEAGRLRAALREVLADEHRPHRAGAA